MSPSDPANLQLVHDRKKLEAQLVELRGRRARLAETPCPYRGLEFFDVPHAADYFGREPMVAKLIDRLQLSNFVAVVGPSGSGKSSLVRAGLIPALRRGDLPGSEGWEVDTFRPGDDPLRSLASPLADRLAPELSLADRLAETRKLADHLAAGTVPIGDVLAQLSRRRPGLPRLVLIADQFEEAFTRCTDEKLRGAFLSTLLQAANTPWLTVILTLRADFYGRVLGEERLSRRVDEGLVNVLPMTPEERRAAIEQPALRAGRAFEQGLVERILAAVKDAPGDLPLLEFALTELWHLQTAAGLLTHAAYEEIGEVEGAIAKRADDTCTGLGADERNTVRAIFTQLVQVARPDEGVEDTRRRIKLAELAPQTAILVQQLVKARLLVTGRDPDSGKETIELAHEALIRGWWQLQDWLNSDREFLLWLQRLRTLADIWDGSGRSEGALLRDALLRDALLRSEGRTGDLNALELTFIRESELAAERAEREKEAARQRELDQAHALAAEQERRAEVERQRAEEQAARAETARRLADEQQARAETAQRLAEEQLVRAETAQRLAETAQSLAQEQRVRADTAQRLAEEQQERADTAQLLAEEQDARAEEQTRANRRLRIRAWIAAASTLITMMAAIVAAYGFNQALAERNRTLSRLSVQLATQATSYLGSQSDLALLLGVEAYHAANTFESRRGLLTALAYQPELSTFIHGSPCGVLSMDYRPYSNGPMAFAPGCRISASGSADGAIILTDGTTNQRIELQGHHAPVLSMAFSPDGKTLASGSEDIGIILWDAATHKQLGSPLFTGRRVPIHGLAFSRDGKTLASGNFEDVILWDVAAREPLYLHPPRSGTGWVQSVAFSPKGDMVASGSASGFVILWNVATQQQSAQLSLGPLHQVNDVAFSPDGETLAVGSCGMLRTDTGDCTRGEISLWTVDVVPLRQKAFTGHTKEVRVVAFSSDGKRLTSEGADGSIIMWDLAARPRLVEPLAGHTQRVSSIVFSPDGKTLASGSCTTVDAGARSCSEGEIRLWDVTTRQPLGLPLIGHDAGVLSMAFSPDGKRLASGSADGTIILWEVATRQQLGPPLVVRTQRVSSIVFSPDGKTLALGSCTMGTGARSCSEGEIRLWDVTTRQPLGLPLIGHDAEVLSMAFSPDGKRLASGSADGTIILWDVATRRQLDPSPSGHEAAVESVAFSPDGRILASGSCARFGEGDADMEVCQEGELGLWDADTLEPVNLTLTGHTREIRSVAFSADGKTLATGSRDGSIILWDVAVRQPLGPPLTGYNSPVQSMAFSPYAATLVSGSSDGTVILWDLSLESWQARACRIANRTLSPVEWSHFFGPGIPYSPACPDLPPREGAPPNAPAASR